MSDTPPYRDPLIEFGPDGKPKWTISRNWLTYLFGRDASIASAPTQIPKVVRAGQFASIGLTPIATGSTSAGAYRLTPFIRVVQAGGLTGTVQLVITFTDGGVVCSHTFPDLITNTVASIQADDTLIVRMDQATVLSYSVTYTSTGAPVMKYDLEIRLERMN